MIEKANKLLETLHQLKPEESEVIERLVDSFLLTNYDLGLNCQLHPDIIESTEYRNYIDLMVKTIQPNRHWLELFITKTKNKFLVGFQNDEWIDICTSRSAIAFLCAMSKGTSLEPYVCSLNVFELEEEMMQVGEREGHLNPERIPKGIPESHWWWWYPDGQN
jgi:hypothetical protein